MLMPIRTFEKPCDEQQDCKLIKGLPLEILEMILEYLLVPQISLTIKNNLFDRYRPEALKNDLAMGRGSCQAQILRTCQELYFRGRAQMYNKASFRLTAHCEGRYNMARTADPSRPKDKTWLPVFYNHDCGRSLLANFQNIELELIPDMGGSPTDGIFITWNSMGVIVDALRFLSTPLRDKNLTVTFMAPMLEVDRVAIDELAIWMGAFELLRCKSFRCPQFASYVELNKNTSPLALVTSNEDVFDLDEIRNDLMAYYFDKMRVNGAMPDRFYDELMPIKFKERALQFNVREYLHLKKLYHDRIDELTKTKNRRHSKRDKRLLEVYDKYHVGTKPVIDIEELLKDETPS